MTLPPGTLVALPVEFTMVQPTEGNGEPVADLPPHPPRFGKLNVMGIRWYSAAEETGLRGHKLQMFAVALTHWLANEVDGLLIPIDW